MDNITEIVIPPTITTIEKNAFYGWGSAGPQTIALPFATVEEAVSAWGTDWLQGNYAELAPGAKKALYLTSGSEFRVEGSRFARV